METQNQSGAPDKCKLHTFDQAPWQGLWHRDNFNLSTPDGVITPRLFSIVLLLAGQGFYGENAPFLTRRASVV